MSFVKAQKNVNGQTVFDLKGNWITSPVFERLQEIRTNGMFFGKTEFEVANEKSVKITFLDNCSDAVVDILVEYIQDNLRPVIGTAFTEIKVNPYKVPGNQNTNGIGLLREIADETGCDVDYGSWNTAVIFKTVSSTQYNEVVDLLTTFDLSFW